MNLLAHVDSKIWAIYPEELQRMRSILAGMSAERIDKIAAARQAEPKALAGDEQAQSLRYGVIGDSGVAVINVSSVLYYPEGLIDEVLAFIFGGTSIPDLARDIDAVANNPAVKAVAFNFHSPGGTVFGINETANKLAALTAKKPTIGYIYGYGASACYFLAAQCGEVVTDAQALIGSIGVVAGWADYTGAYEMLGIAYEEVTSTHAPYKRLDIRKPEERAVFMAEIDGLEAVFIKSVAKARKVSPDFVKSDFGRGAVMAGYLAVKAGMADRVGSLEEVIRNLQFKSRKSGTVSAEGEDMRFKDEFNKFATALGFKVTEEAPAADPPQSEAERLRAEKEASDAKALEAAAALEKVKAEQAEKITAQIKTDCDAFVEAECAAGRLFPAEKATFAVVYAQAASDDLTAPLSEGSRLETLKANQEKRLPHGFTKEQVNADDNTVFILGLADSPTTKMQKEAEDQVNKYVATVNPQGGVKVVAK